jgi:hypothetical protein
MNGRFRTLFLVLLFLISFICATGCASVRTADTHNTTVAVKEYNAWVVKQQGFDRDVRDIIAQMGIHIQTYNSEIAKDQPDYILLRSNLANDRQLLDRWGRDLDDLNAATEQFSKNTSGPQYDNTSVVRTHQILSLMTQYMNIYAANMGNARQHLIEYINNAESYTSTDTPDYWNDNYRQAAMNEKDQATSALADSDTALGNVTEQARQLENMQ